MSFKVLPRFIEELGTEYTSQDSKYFLGKDKLKEFPSVLNHINKLTSAEASLFSNYMRSGELVYAWMGLVKDPIDSKYNVCTGEYSDGVFFWYDMHIYLVQKYRIDLPKEFKAHIISFGNDYAHLKKLDQGDLQVSTRKSENILLKY